MNRFAWMIAAVLAAGALVGCNDDKKTAPMEGARVGVVNLDRAISEIEMDKRMNEKLAQAQEMAKAALERTGNKLQEKLNDVNKKLQEEIEKAQKAAGSRPLTTQPEAVQKLSQQASGLRNLFNQADQFKGQQLQAYRAKMLLDFRTGIRPTVQEMGVAKKASVVVQEASTVYFEAEADLTTELVNRLKALKTPLALPDIPKEIGEDVPGMDKALQSLGL